MNDPRLSRRALVAGAAAVATSVALPRLARALAFPSRPITIVLPYTAGGPVDLCARSIADPLFKLLGQPVIVDARPGASGLLATRQVAHAPPDGHTLLIQTPNILIAPQLMKKPDFAPLTDVEPVTMVGSQPFVLLAHSSLPARNMKEFLAYAKANPGKLEYGTAGAASFSRLATELLMAQADINMVHVPYKGVGASMQAIYSGEIKVLFATMSPQILEFVKTGKIRMLGVATLEPSPLVPGVEPIARTIKGFEAVVWMGLFAPKGTPHDAMAKIQQAVARTLASADYKPKAEILGVEADSTSGDAMRAKMQREYASWGEVIRKANISEE